METKQSCSQQNKVKKSGKKLGANLLSYMLHIVYVADNKMKK